VILDLFAIFSQRGIGLLCSSLVLFLVSVSSSRAQWVRQVSGTESRLRGVSAVSDRVCWATGARGTVLLTTDGGDTEQKKTERLRGGRAGFRFSRRRLRGIRVGFRFSRSALC
jgi:photosystem II stability/assembly factor-like uncharacterized protein